jgi:NTP pyrophosphatase (non-canonical NTP hydrolase)
MGKTMAEWQQIVDDWIQTYGGGYWHPLSNLARVVEEVGELARLLNHFYGEKPKKPTEAEQEMGIEICDIIFALICLANREGIDLEKSFEQMMAKYVKRDTNRFIQDSNDERSSA